MKASSRVGTRAVRYAMMWRPRYVATVALTRSPIIAARTARISPTTALAHRRDDPDFAEQYLAAEEHATQLLHDACFASALEGDCEPVFWQGIKVGHIRKFDSRLRIEMLRAYNPAVFKAPGSTAVTVNAGSGSKILIIGPEEHAELCAARKASLLRLKAAQAGEQPSTPLSTMCDGVFAHHWWAFVTWWVVVGWWALCVCEWRGLSQ